MQTYHADCQELGAEVPDAGYEYEIYAKLQTLFPNNQSAGWELLRFGRVVGPDTLPANAPHWRKVWFGTGAGWVDLNAAAIKKFSDADFPMVDGGWRVVDGSASKDSRCVDPAIRNLLDSNGDLNVSPQEWNQALSDPGVQQRLAHKICKFQTEWDDATVDARFAWLAKDLVLDKRVWRPRLSAENLAKHNAHAKALCFWKDAKLKYTPAGQSAPVTMPAAHWHFNPRQFVTHFRKCGWLKAEELAQFIPRQMGRTSIAWATAAHNANLRVLSVNIAMRKYNLWNAIRQIHFLAQIYTETGILRDIREGNQGSNKEYEAFYGRGLMQLTWLGGYAQYGLYRRYPNVGPNASYGDPRITHTSTHLVQHAGAQERWYPRYDPEIVADDPMASGDSAGFFWVSKVTGGAHRGFLPITDRDLSPQHVAEASFLVNGGGTGFVERQIYAVFIARYRMDDNDVTPTAQFVVRFVSEFIWADQPPHHIRASRTATVFVDFTAQRP
jgi:hypothetical protein